MPFSIRESQPMPSLADLQAQVRTALLDGNTAPLTPALVGGSRPDRRLAIHARHYETSLVRTLVERFPATAWLVGSEPVIAAARRFVRSCPPTRPCLAEYGEGFPSLLGASAGARVPYLRDFAELEYRIGSLALAVERQALPLSVLAAMPEDDLPAVVLDTQPGATYLRVDWDVDGVIDLYLTDAAPDRYEITRGLWWLEIRGNRGDVQVHRLSPAEFAFRAAVAGGQTLGQAVERGVAAEDTFDAGRALAGLFAERLVTGVHRPGMQEAR
jgi:hypothetical protein